MCQVRHVRQAFPDRLVDVAVPGDGQMSRENGIGIDQDIVFAALAAFELQGALLFRAGVGAKETRTGLDRGFVDFSGRGADAGRIVLDADRQPADRQFAGLRIFQGAEIGGGQGPDRQLVPDEFIEDVLFSHFASMRRRAASSTVRILSL